MNGFVETKCHIDCIKVGDTVLHNGATVTVSAGDLRFSKLLGRTLFGDSYRIGTLPVTRLDYVLNAYRGHVTGGSS